MAMIYVLTAISVFQGLVLLFLLYKIRSSKKRQDTAIDGLFNACENILGIITRLDELYITEISLKEKFSIRIVSDEKKNCCGEFYQEKMIELLFDDEVISRERLS